ncbi:sensor domain-containing diguanylate cyclase [Vibrio ponticus]|uniref:sensor domain-containing diguanylate cyclase n=1 Tax=Vibrio ponticus TaxID=265668 RepID=UPI0021A8C54A|nr:sensor domain-containing diguanylate cyclase [Vibrio ponticus]
MITDDKIGYKRLFVGITTLFIIILTFLVLDSAEESQQKYERQKQRVERLLEDTSQVINALDYSITSLYPLQNDRYVLPHTIKLNGDTCNFGGKSHTGKEYDFMFSGPKEMCDNHSLLFQEAYRRLFVAPSMAYFAKSINHISSIYFISTSKFIISSPKAFAQAIEGDAFDKVISTRPYWVRTVACTENQDGVIYTGDYQDYMTGKRVVTITRGIYVDGRFKGVLAIDNDLDDLIEDYIGDYQLTEEQGANSSDVFSFTYSQPVLVGGKETGLYLTINEPKRIHLWHIFEVEKQRLIALIAFYILALCIIWFRYTQVTHLQLKQLAMLDPMTNLLNRRGFAAKLKDLPVSQYLAIAVFDIDNFKAINDSCGHQVGDDIICQVAKLLSTSLRQTDLIARFGGEEFVIAITSETAELAQLVLERVQSDISSPEIRLCDETISVTASGGAIIYKMNKMISAVQVWQGKGIVAADKLLYQAKKAGKNRIIIDIDNG